MFDSVKGYQVVDSYWYDKVPSHWKKTKNKYVFNQNKHVVGKDWERLTLLTMGKSGVKPRDMDGGGKFPASFENYQTVEPNQLIFCLFDLDETPRTIGISKDYGMITSAYDVFSTTESNDPNFWTYFYQMIDDHKGLRPFYTGLRKVVRSETFMSIEVFSPPLEEQKLISRYLDKKIDHIDKLIEKIQLKINLLDEKHTSLIKQCVAEDFDSNVNVNYNNSETRKKKIKYLFKISKGAMPQILNNEIKKDNFPYLSMNVLRGGRPTEFTKIDNCVFVSKGDIGILWDGSNAGEILKMNLDGVLSSTVALLTIKDPNLNQNYAFYVLKSYENLIKFNTIGMGIPHVDGNSLKNIEVYLPSIDIQKKIVNNLEKKLSKLIKLRSYHFDKFLLLKEYRQSLISSAVTGKIRITENMI